MVDVLVAEARAAGPIVPLVWEGNTLNLGPAEGAVAEAVRVGGPTRVAPVKEVGRVPTVSAKTGASCVGNGHPGSAQKPMETYSQTAARGATAPVPPKTTGMEVLKRLWNPQIHQHISPEYQEIQGRIFWKTGTLILIFLEGANCF